MMIKTRIIFKTFIYFFLPLYYSTAFSQSTSPLDGSAIEFIKGADIGWLPQMEASGFKFYGDDGLEQDCFQILKEHGINAIRIRTWVNPSDDRQSGHCSKEETVSLALRAKGWDMKIMIDFHYSDSWADPAKQNKPAAWLDHSFPELLADVYDYTYDVMKALVAEGITPEWVQVGNEITNGMLWPEGKSSDNWKQLAQLLNQGYDAVKVASHTSKVIMHVDNGHDKNITKKWFDNAKENKVKYDIIGLSYYPFWSNAKLVEGTWLNDNPDYKLTIDDLGDNMIDLASSYGKDVMIVETGDMDDQPDRTYDMLVAVQQKVKEIPNNKGLGVFYWEPEGARSWSGYGLSAWGQDGKPTRAMDAFLAK